MVRQEYYPIEENLGKNCEFWNMDGNLECSYPKHELEGRRSCEGVIDDVCLFIKDGRTPTSLSEAQRVEIKTRIPDKFYSSKLPPGDIDPTTKR